MGIKTQLKQVKFLSNPFIEQIQMRGIGEADPLLGMQPAGPSLKKEKRCLCSSSHCQFQRNKNAVATLSANV